MAARFSLFFSFIGVLLSTISVLTAANLLYPTSTIFMVVAVLDLLSGNVYSRPFGVSDDEFSQHPGTLFTCSLIAPNLGLTKISLVFNTVRTLQTLVMFIVSASMNLLWLDRFLETCFIRLDSPEVKRLIVLVPAFVLLVKATITWAQNMVMYRRCLTGPDLITC